MYRDYLTKKTRKKTILNKVNIFHLIDKVADKFVFWIPTEWRNLTKTFKSYAIKLS